MAVIPCTATGVQAFAGGANLLLYPNPNNGVFYIELANGQSKAWEKSDLSGRLLMGGNSEEAKIRIDLNEYARGIYYVKVKSEGISKVVRIIKD